MWSRQVLRKWRHTRTGKNRYIDWNVPEVRFHIWGFVPKSITQHCTGRSAFETDWQRERAPRARRVPCRAFCFIVSRHQVRRQLGGGREQQAVRHRKLKCLYLSIVRARPRQTCLKVLHLWEISSSRCAEDLHAVRMLPGMVSEVGLSPNKNVIMHADFEPRCIQCPTA